MQARLLNLVTATKYERTQDVRFCLLVWRPVKDITIEDKDKTTISLLAESSSKVK